MLYINKPSVFQGVRYWCRSFICGFGFFSLILLPSCTKKDRMTISKFCVANPIYRKQPIWMDYFAESVSNFTNKSTNNLSYAKASPVDLIKCGNNIVFMVESISAKEDSDDWSSRISFAERRARRRFSKEIDATVQQTLGTIIANDGSPKMKASFKSWPKRIFLNIATMSILVSNLKSIREWYDCEKGVFFSEMVLNIDKAKKDLLESMQNNHSALGIDISDEVLKNSTSHFVDTLAQFIKTSNVEGKLTEKSFGKVQKAFFASISNSTDSSVFNSITDSEKKVVSSNVGKTKKTIKKLAKV